MGRHILYITNYYLDDVVEQRASAPFISQAGQNKSKYMIRMLQMGQNEVNVWSNAWTSSTCFRFYKGFQSKIDPKIHYADIVGIPFLNIWACKQSCKRFIREFQSKHRLDAIVFYNMRLENAPVALWAKKKWGIPIILQYEDGLTQDANVFGIKKTLYRRVEKKIMPSLDGTFLVNSKIRVNCPSVVIRGAVYDTNPRMIMKNRVQGDHIPIVLYAGTLDNQRGIKVLLDALDYIGEDFRLKITGRGEYEKTVADFADRRVEYMGYLDYASYRDVLNTADICISAQLSKSVFGNFSFPSKISEYLSEYKLVVSSDVADAKEAIGQVSFIYKNDEPKQLAGALERAIEVWKDEEKYREHMEKIDAYLEENSIKHMAEKANQMLDEIIGEG